MDLQILFHTLEGVSGLFSLKDGTYEQMFLHKITKPCPRAFRGI